MVTRSGHIAVHCGSIIGGPDWPAAPLFIGTRVFFVGALGAPIGKGALPAAARASEAGDFSRSATAGSEQGIDLGCWDSAD